MSVFQFLIGRLGTHHIGPVVEHEVQFQFLIGRLGTPFLPDSLRNDERSFNSS